MSFLSRRAPGPALVAFALLALGSAPDPARNALTPPEPKPVRPPGTMLFIDDFRSGSLDQWQVDRDGVWSVVHGMLRADLPDQPQLRSFAYAGSEAWSDYAVDLDVCQMRGVDKGVVVRVEGRSGVGVDLRGPGYQDVLLYRREFPLGKARIENGNGTWHHVRVEALGDRYRVWVNGTLAIDRRDRRSARPRGRIALPAYTGGAGQCTVYYDNVAVTALKEEALGARP